RTFTSRLHQERRDLAIEGGYESVAVLKTCLPQGQIERLQIQQSRSRSSVNQLPLPFADQALFLEHGMIAGFQQLCGNSAFSFMSRTFDQCVKFADRQSHENAILYALQFLWQ